MFIGVLVSLSAARTSSSAQDAPSAVFTGCNSQAQIPVSECRALVALYNSTDGPRWKEREGWLQTNIPCEWYGVECGGNSGNVKALFLALNRMGGTLPEQLADLTEVEALYLDRNEITGTLPPEWGSLAKLKIFRFSFNQLTGTIPATYSGMTALEDFRLDFNKFDGVLPASFGTLPNLKQLVLSGNRFTGSIPAEWGGLAALTHLFFYENRLTGALPAELGSLSNLRFWRFDYNQFTGPIPPSYANLSNIEEINFSFNQLSGALPTGLFTLPKLRTLDLGHNLLSGAIPPQVENADALRKLDLSFNQFTGGIPPQLGALTNLDELYLSLNQLSGPIPSELGAMAALNILNLNGNRLTGEVPASIANLTGINYPFFEISYNALTANNPGVIAYLNSREATWNSTQNIPPSNVSGSINEFGELVIDWTPIPYNFDPGYYEVGCGGSSGGTYDAFVTLTVDKLTAQATLSGLEPGAYFCAVRTVTLPHANNPSTLTSAYSPEMAATVEALPTPPNDSLADAAPVNVGQSQFVSLNIANAVSAAGVPKPSCAPTLTRQNSRVIFYEIPAGEAGKPGPFVSVAGGPPHFEVRNGATPVDTVLVIYRRNKQGALIETACNDNAPDASDGYSRTALIDGGGVTYVAALWVKKGATVESVVVEFKRDTRQPVNGGFDVDKNRDKLPDRWQPSNLDGDALICNTPNAKPAYSAPCAFQFVGQPGEGVQKLTQNLPKKFVESLTVGQELTLGAYVRRLNSAANTVIVAKLTYADGSKETISLSVPPGQTKQYEPFLTLPFPLPQAVTAITMEIRYAGKAGKVRLDEVTLSAGDSGAGLGVVALPAAPDAPAGEPSNGLRR
jgi:Leucine-rich repeat (LRR) protein